jgi:hypothetical protein
MTIEYYINSTTVSKAEFKRFSSQCHAWHDLLEQYSAFLQLSSDTLMLVYVPLSNDVKHYYKENACLDMIRDEARKAKRKGSGRLRKIPSAETVFSL